LGLLLTMPAPHISVGVLLAALRWFQLIRLFCFYSYCTAIRAYAMTTTNIIMTVIMTIIIVVIIAMSNPHCTCLKVKYALRFSL
jgi:hypothetical protein